MDNRNETNKKIKFRSVSTTDEPLLGPSRLEELSLPRPRSKSEHKYKKKDTHLSDNCDGEDVPSLLGFLGVELTRGYALEHDEEQYSAKREKVYSFMSVPREVEKFMIYGFFQCADSFLFVYTFLPLRFLLAFWAMITRPIKKCFGHKSKSLLTPAEKCDLLKSSLLIVCSIFMFYVDTSIMYHLIKSQSVIKLYIFYNMLEVGDRLFSAFGQDIIDALFWTATEPRGRRREHLGLIPHYLFAIIYVFLHALLVLSQATTLNVAINSNNKSLLTIMMSNNSYPVSLEASQLPFALLPPAYPQTTDMKSYLDLRDFNPGSSDQEDPMLPFSQVLHAFLVLWQATTLNVAINSNNKALLTIMMSNNFVELKGSVFKKFDKNNLFQVACSDVRERFHLFVLLSIVVLQTMKEYAWKEETLWVLVPDCVMVLVAEVVVDWIKHAFITRFNELPVEVYRDYRLSLAYDMAQTRQKNAFTDHSDLVARRMGFIPLPLGVVMVRVLGHAVRIQGTPALTLAVLGYMCIASYKILNNIFLLGKACQLIYHHQQERMQQDTSSPVRFIKDSATSPTRPQVIRSPTPGLRRSVTVGGTPEHIRKNPSQDLNDVPTEKLPNLGSPAIFSNSAVNIADVCLNEEMLRVGVGVQLESIGEAESDCLTRSVPNIQQETDSAMPTLSRSPSPSPELGKKRAESEPSIPHLIENELLEMQSGSSNS